MKPERVHVDKPTAFSMFSGIGGLCEGFHLAGFHVVGASERDKYACASYRNNFPEIPLFEGDVADLFPESCEKTKRRHIAEYGNNGRVDVVFGGPPCQGFSQIGPRDVGDPRNEMYLHLCRVAQLLSPSFILMENVPNMLLMRGGMFRERITKAFIDIGYSNIGLSVLDSSLFGVPQQRKRVFIIAAKKRLPVNMQSIFNTTCESLEDNLVTVDEAISDLPETTSDESMDYPKKGRGLSAYQREMRCDCEGRLYSSRQKMEFGNGSDDRRKLHGHHTKEIQETRLSLIMQLEQGAKADSLPVSVWNNARPEKWRRFHPDRPAHTLLAQMHRDLSEWIHPHFHRWITVREAMRLMAFHDGFILKSSEWQQLKQVGNAVPPLLGRVPAMAIRYAISKIAGESPPFEIKGQR